MTVDEFKELSSLLERVIHKYNIIEKKPWDYGNGILLSRAEIHSIMLIKTQPGISVTELAHKRGITKGAASQLLYKMVDKGLVKKETSPNSDAQICLYLTDVGQEVNRLHDEYHQNNAEPFFQYLTTLPEDTSKSLIKTMEYFDTALDARMDEIL